ncbi:MAG: hypothetical protein RBR09_00145 [Desulfobulbaceae bacterium]|nr:hypothetical protein [Desulfobulbaceae bacterium]MDY0349639.1 hypothetical protein [Desulfobulbaceae bacterium]
MNEFILSVYGNPPPPKRANLDEAITVAAKEILMGIVDRQEVRKLAEIQHSGPIPYSTHDLALSVATSFFDHPDYAESLKDFRALVLLQSIMWFQEGLVAPVWVENFEKILTKLDQTGS